MKKILFLLIVFLTSQLYNQSVNDLMPRGEAFFIQSALNVGKNKDGYWDIPGGESKIRSGANLQVWNLGNNEKDRRYVIDNSKTKGYIRLHIDGVAAYLDVEKGSDKNGTKLQIYEPNNSSSQNFTFRYQGSGKFKIYNENGKAVTLEGRSSANGKALQLWEDQEGGWNEWVLISSRTLKVLNLDSEIKKLASSIGDDMSNIKPVYIQSAVSYGKNLQGYFDIPGIKEPAKGNNIQVHSLQDFNADRLYQIIPSNTSISHYSIAIADDNQLLVDVSNNKTANGTNIGLWEMNNNPAQNFYFKHLGDGRFKIYTNTGKVVCLNNRSSADGNNVIIWDDHDGPWMEWYLIDAETNKPYLPNGLKTGDYNISSVTLNPQAATETKQLCTDIDNFFKKIDLLEKKSNKVISKILSTGGALVEAEKVTSKVSSLNSKTNDILDALLPFERIPVVGSGVKGLSTGLGVAISQLGKINTSLSVIQKKVLEPANKDMEYSLKQNILTNSQLRYMKRFLFEVKQKLSGMGTDGNTSVQNFDEAGFKIKVTDLFASIGTMENNFSEIESNCKSLSKIEEPSKKVFVAVKNFDKSLKLVDKVADEINKVLDKRFKKEIAKVKINISVRDILGGGKVGKVFDKYASSYVEDVLRPVMKKLKIKLPEIPGADKLKDSLSDSINYTDKIKTNSNTLEAISAKFTSLIQSTALVL